MNLEVIAKRYTKSLMQSSKDEQEIDFFYSKLVALNAIFEIPELKDVLSSNYKKTDNFKEDVALEIIGKKNKKIVNFIKILIKNRRFNLIPYIADNLRYNLVLIENKFSAKITTSYSLEDNDKAKLENSLNKRIKKNLVYQYVNTKKKNLIIEIKDLSIKIVFTADGFKRDLIKYIVKSI